MSSITLQSNTQFEYGDVSLPTSKSLSNRVLIIRALCNEPFNILSLSNSNDTNNLVACLSNLDKEINVGMAGTNMRFLISLLSIQPGTYRITGDSRMQKRPIADLVDCLRGMGAEIEYANEKGFPPLKITGKELGGGKAKIKASISSQFISSLLMIAPRLKGGLELEMLEPIVSSPYVEMTLELMKYFGIEYQRKENIIQVVSQSYQSKTYEVEPDWSSAAFWYGLIATSKIGTKVFLQKIRSTSFQGDQKAIEYFKQLGVHSIEKENGILIEKTGEANDHLSFDLINEPDLFPVLAYSCAALRLTASFTGLKTLNLKESNRIEAASAELKKAGAICEAGQDYFTLSKYNALPNKISFDVHNDHRLAMSATMFISSCESVIIHDKEVVSKSYPAFWETIQAIGIANIY